MSIKTLHKFGHLKIEKHIWNWKEIHTKPQFIIKHLGPYSQCITFFITSKWPNKLVLQQAGMERLAKNKHSSLLVPFVSFKEYEVFEFFFAAYRWAQKVRVLHRTSMERLARNKHSSLLTPFVNYKEYEMLWICHQSHIHINSISL